MAQPDVHAVIGGFGGARLELHKGNTLASGTITVNVQMARPKTAIVYLSDGETAVDDSYAYSISGQVITVTSDDGSAAEDVDVLVIGF